MNGVLVTFVELVVACVELVVATSGGTKPPVNLVACETGVDLVALTLEVDLVALPLWPTVGKMPDMLPIRHKEK